MTDMLFFKDSAVHVFYNKYSANGASDSNLCKGTLDTSYISANRIFSLFSDLGTDNSVSNLKSLNIHFIEH